MESGVMGSRPWKILNCVNGTIFQMDLKILDRVFLGSINEGYEMDSLSNEIRWWPAFGNSVSKLRVRRLNECGDSTAGNKSETKV
jgi:hypothetical protein